MGSFAYFTINDYPVAWDKNHLNTWYFKKKDREIFKRKVSERNGLIWSINPEDEEETCYVYRMTARTLIKRLELAGYNMQKVQLEFKESSLKMFEELDYWTKEYQQEYGRYSELLRSAKLEDWLDSLREVVKNKYQGNQWKDPISYENPITDYIVNKPIIFEEYPFELNFPCVSFEGFFRAVAEVVDPEAVCEIDATGLVLGGWTNSFDDLIEYRQPNTNIYSRFSTAIEDIEGLLVGANNKILTRLLFANVITAMESYLSDTIKKNVLGRPALLRRFVESNQQLKEKKFTISEVFKVVDSIESTVSQLIDETTFHNLPKTISLYKSVLDVDFPSESVSVMQKAISQRHDIVHRNGKTIKGDELDISNEDVSILILLIKELISKVDYQVKDGLLDDDED